MNKNINIELMNNIRLCFNVIKRARQSSDLPHGYGRIMAVICHHDGLTQSELADLLDIRPQSLTRSLADLEENGYMNVYHFDSEDVSYEKIDELLKDGDVVLFKASHSMKLGNIVNYLMR